MAKIKEQDSELRESTDEFIQILQDHIDNQQHPQYPDNWEQEPVKQTEESGLPNQNEAKINIIAHAANAADDEKKGKGRSSGGSRG